MQLEPKTKTKKKTALETIQQNNSTANELPVLEIETPGEPSKIREYTKEELQNRVPVCVFLKPEHYDWLVKASHFFGMSPEYYLDKKIQGMKADDLTNGGTKII